MTICSYDNSGQLKFDVDIEMEQGYWNTSSSRLWTRIRDLMHDDIVTTYNNMRQNGVSYENMMKYIYDEQIAKIPQTYYNKDYDVKYAPFADSYIGMAHGDTYEHVKRWLKQRFTFVDTLFDYAPSYNNDVLTIRANTTELMTLEIETYTPVYQHLSWYNGQMDKKKIDGKVSVEFSGTAQAATDQEVLIYGGSNVKSIKGITSMNPNRMLIGSATKLIEIDAHDCPLLADINANKANLSPHEYLNKVNLSNCPLLEGNLRLNNSPLVQEINIKGTNITGMNLPNSIRNLQTLRLPNTMTDLTLNDAGMLHTLDFDVGVNLQSVSMTNCNALENVIGLDLLQTPSITLNNSYNTVAELYFKDTTNLSLSNMSNLERVIFTPNNEYETFELINVANAPDYKVTTFNCPKLSTFMTTAPYRESYNNGDYGDIQPNTTFTANSIDISNTQFTDVKLLCTTDTNTLKLPTTVKNFYCDSSFDLDTDYLTDGEYDVVHGELIEPYTTDYDGEVSRIETGEIITEITKWITGYNAHAVNNVLVANSAMQVTDYIEVVPGSTIYVENHTATSAINLMEYRNKDDEKVRYSSSHLFNYGSRQLQSDTKFVRINTDINATLTIRYNGVNSYTPNLIPSSADGSLIFSMYAPSNTVAPVSGTWDLKGLEFDNFHTFGMNNDVKGGYEGWVYNRTSLKSDNGCAIEDFVKIQFKRNASELINYPFIIYYKSKRYNMYLDETNIYHLDITTPLYTYNKTGEEGIYELCLDLINLTIEIYGITIPFSKLYSATSSTANKFVIYNTDFDVYLRDFIPLTMPARYDDYNITIKNANISPKTHNTMLYPLLVNEDNPITGTLDYTNYAGKHLSWSFAYTDEEYVNIIQPKAELINSYEFRYNAFYQTDYEFDNPYEVARYTSSASGVLPSFNAEFTYTYDEIDNGDGTYTTRIYADSLDNLPTSISFAGKSELLTVDSLSVTNNVQYLSYLFSTCLNLSYVNTNNWDTSNVKSMINLCYNCTNLTSLDVSGFDTSNVTNMSNMFNGCKNLTSLDVSGFDTSKVTDMSNMFNGCKNLTSLDLSEFDTSEVIYMYYMFYGCNNLTSLDLSGFDTSNVTDMSYMLYNCANITSLDLSGFATSNVTTIHGMFSGCSKLTSLDLSGFDTSNVINMSYMFQNCKNLTSLDLSGLDTSKVTSMTDMFNGCSGLTSLNVENWTSDSVNTIIPQLSVSPSTSTLYGTVPIDESTLPTGWVYEYNDINVFLQFTASTNSTGLVFFNTSFTEYEVSTISLGSNLYQYTYQYTGSSKPTSIRFYPTSGTSYAYTIRSIKKLVLTDASSLGSMFAGCSNLTSIDLSRVSIGSSATSMEGMFCNCTSLIEIIGLNSLNTSNITNMSQMFYGCSTLFSLDVSGLNTSNVTNMANMFDNCSSLPEIIGLNNFNTSKVINMSYMFYRCSKLTSLDVSGFDTSRVTNMSYMFRGCSNLKELDVSDFNTDNVTNMNSLFYSCSNITSLDLSGFDTTKVAKMDYMFASCSKLTSLDLSNFNTSSVTNMASMFHDCSELTSLNLRSFDTSNVTNMASMFYGCSGLTSLDLSNFNTNKVTNMKSMFQGCNRLTSLDLSGLDTSKVTNMSSMFSDCSSLIELDPMQNISTALNLSTTILDATSLLDVINNLATVTTTKTLALGTTLLAKLTEDQIAIATNKGWTVA